MRWRRISRFFNGLLITLRDLEVIHRSHCYAIARLCVHTIRSYYNANYTDKDVKVCEMRLTHRELKIETAVTHKHYPHWVVILCDPIVKDTMEK